MQLSPGVRLGPYEVLSSLGAGGMGEVYRARDTRLDRMVAVKILPAEFANDARLRMRFEREAKAISALSHPNICTLHDIGQQDGVDYLVLEFLEGETLADRIARGSLPLDQALAIGMQICDALDRAHRQGIIHRDLKPGNVMLTKSGAKLLDFGLSTNQALGPVLSGVTEQKPLTEEGVIVGTFQYMAPEQIEGKDADARTDIFAFGALLYEMVTGRRAFGGKTKISLIAAILEQEPAPIQSLQPLSPAALHHVIAVCLKKDPDERWQTARDVALELQWIRDSGEITTAPAAKRNREMVLAAALILALAGMAIITTLWYRVQNKPLPVIATSILPPEGTNFSFDDGAPALSPDGTRVTFVARDASSKLQLWVRALNSMIAQPLTGTEGASYPFWSPDGRYIGFFAGGKLKKIDASGGPPLSLADATVGRGGTWNRDGVIVFAPHTNSPLMRVSAAGGIPVPLTRFDPTRPDRNHRWPQFLPDGEHVIFLSWSGVYSFAGTNDELDVVSIKTGQRKNVTRTEGGAQYAEPGYLLLRRNGALVALPFDARRLQITGEPLAIVEDVRHTLTQNTTFSVSNDGRLLFQAGKGLGLSQLSWRDRSGKSLGTIGTPAEVRFPMLSPDGTRLAVSRTDAGQTGDIWIVNLARQTWTRFTFDSAHESSPVWSPDGSSIAYTLVLPNGSVGVYVKSTSGIGEPQPLVTMSGVSVPSDWSRDGRYLFFQNRGGAGSFDLWVYSFPEKKTYPFAKSTFNETLPRLSPDGKWIAYVSDESGAQQVYVQTFPDSGGKWQVSTAGGTRPRWSRNGDELFYIANNMMMSVPVRTSPQFEAGLPQPLFEVLVRTSPDSTYAVADDGKRFIVSEVQPEAERTPMTLIQNWYAAARK